MTRATRDYRHGPSRRKPYQRRSQAQSQPVVNDSKGGIKNLLSLVVLLTVVLFLGFWVAQHFSTEGVKSTAETVTSQPLTSDFAETIVVPSEKEPELAAQVAPIVVESLPMPDRAETESVQYTFYQGLAETEVIVDAEPISVKLDHPYYILAGTFSSESVARQEVERLQSKQQEVELYVYKSDINIYYRLRVGPFEDRLALNKKRNVLRSLGVDTQLIRSQK